MIFKFKHRELGGHTHVWLYAGTYEHTTGLAGRFVLRNEEWEVFRAFVAGTLASDVRFEEASSTNLWEVPVWMEPYAEKIDAEPPFSITEYVVAYETRWYPPGMSPGEAHRIHDQVKLLTRLNQCGMLIKEVLGA